MNRLKMKPINLILIIFFLVGCNSNNNHEIDTPTSGQISISIDEAFYPFIDSEVTTFNSLYKYAKIDAHFVSEPQAFEDLLKDSARLIVVSRDLRDEERKYFEQIKITPRVLKIAVDALALIVNKENPDSSISYQQLKNIFNGKTTKWNEINQNSKLSDIQVVFDNKNSGTARYIKENINNGKQLPPNCYAVNTNSEVVDYISKNKNAIGIIGVNWISDGDDPKSKSFLNKIKVISVGTADATGFFQPYQAYMALKNYPLCRDVFIISREARSGLGTGFASFVAGDEGQRIILKSGLLPSTMPVRIIGLK